MPYHQGWPNISAEAGFPVISRNAIDEIHIRLKIEKKKSSNTMIQCNSHVFLSNTCLNDESKTLYIYIKFA